MNTDDLTKPFIQSLQKQSPEKTRKINRKHSQGHVPLPNSSCDLVEDWPFLKFVP